MNTLTPTGCNHKEWRDGHCAEMSCKNYINKCPRHATVGDRLATCSQRTSDSTFVRDNDD